MKRAAPVVMVMVLIMAAGSFLRNVRRLERRGHPAPGSARSPGAWSGAATRRPQRYRSSRAATGRAYDR